MVTTVGVIGSAGRRADAKKMTKEIYYAMVAKAERVIRQHFKLDPKQVHLVSGGAAWAGCGERNSYFIYLLNFFVDFRSHCCGAVRQ